MHAALVAPGERPHLAQHRVALTAHVTPRQLSVRQPRDVEPRAARAGCEHNFGSDAWYVIVTISTVGYGDRYPVTNQGRFFGALIIIIVVRIFGTFIG
jgi:hypothetical protein